MAETGASPGRTGAYATGSRTFAALGAAVSLALFLVQGPWALARGGHPWSAALLFATALPFVAFLVLLATSPGLLQRLVARRTALDLRDSVHVAAAVVIASTLFFVLGYGGLVQGAYAVETVLAPGDEGEALLEDVDGNALFVGLTVNILVLTLPPLLYVGFVHGGGPAAAVERLGLRLDGAGRATGIGLLVALAAFLLLAVAGLVYQSTGLPPPENPRALAVARSVTVLGAVGLSLGAAVSEEVFFRGFLQPRIGLAAQAVIFGLVHLSYASLSELLVVTVLGFAFGALYRWTGHLLAPIAAHFLFNAINLIGAQAAA